MPSDVRRRMTEVLNFNAIEMAIVFTVTVLQLTVTWSSLRIFPRVVLG